MAVGICRIVLFGTYIRATGDERRPFEIPEFVFSGDYLLATLGRVRMFVSGVGFWIVKVPVPTSRRGGHRRDCLPLQRGKIQRGVVGAGTPLLNGVTGLVVGAVGLFETTALEGVISQHICNCEGFSRDSYTLFHPLRIF